MHVRIETQDSVRLHSDGQIYRLSDMFKVDTRAYGVHTDNSSHENARNDQISVGQRKINGTGDQAVSGNR